MNILYYPGSDGIDSRILEEKVKRYNTTVVRAPDGADRRDMLRYYLLGTPYDLVVLDESNEIEVIDLTDRVVGVVEGSLSPYAKHPKPKVAVVGHNTNLIRMLNGTHRNTGIKFIHVKKDGDNFDLCEDSCSQ